jgi:hypothetical protein
MSGALWIGRVTYGPPERAWLNAHDHYLNNAPPGALLAVGVLERGADLFGHAIGIGGLKGLCLVGRPVAPALPQDGTWGEVSRMYLVAGLPHGTASLVLNAAADLATKRGVKVLIAYHDRTRHTGCIYRKAGFRRDGGHLGTSHGWATSRKRPASEVAGSTPKRRWRRELAS